MPFGETSFGSFGKKRYRFVGKERDEESGLCYYGARYYALWMCRFVSVDPLFREYSWYTPYQYAGNKPIIAIDLDGLEPANQVEGGGNSGGGMGAQAGDAQSSDTVFPPLGNNAPDVGIGSEPSDGTSRSSPEIPSGDNYSTDKDWGDYSIGELDSIIGDFSMDVDFDQVY